MRTTTLSALLVASTLVFPATPALARMGGHRLALDRARTTASASDCKRTSRASLFSPTSPWNTAVSRSASLEPSSPTMVAGLVQQVHRYGTGFNTASWSVPIYIAAAGQETARVALDNPNRYLQQAWQEVPLPAGAQPAAGSDRQLVVWQPASDTMWEFWHMEMRSDGWHAEYGGRIVDVSENPGYYVTVAGAAGGFAEQSWWGATATGLPLAAGLVTAEEARCGSIDHALALALPSTRQGQIAWPAQRGDGKDPSPTAIPEGARLRLDPSLDLATLEMPPFTRMLARAAQRYGLIVRDGAGSVALYGEAPPANGADPWPQLTGNLKPWQYTPSFPWAHLQVLRSDLRAYPAPPAS